MTTYISLFCGCGGFDFGFSKYFECLGAYDIEKSAIDSFKENLSDNAYLHDLLDLKLPNLEQASKAEILLAGSPCQGFSTVGQRKFDDPRNLLLYTAADVAEIIKPKVVVCENVPAVKSGKHAIYWENLIAKFSRLGYNTEEFLYDFSNYGLAQTRKRIFLIAYRGEKVDRSLLELKKDLSTSLSDILKGVEHLSDNELLPLAKTSDIEIARMIKPGQKLSNVRGGENSVATWEIPEVFGEVSESEKNLLESIRVLRRRHRVRKNGDADPVSTKTLDAHYSKTYIADLESLIKKGYLVEKGVGLYDIKGTFNGKYRRLRLDTPSYTVDTNFGNPRYFLHPMENRGLSVREAARIQSFPDNFKFIGNIKQKYRMIGNAVPPLISEKIAKVVDNVFFDQG